MWRLSHQPIMNLGDPANHGWKDDLSIDWIETPYPPAELLFDKVPQSDEDNEDENDKDEYEPGEVHDEETEDEYEGDDE